MLQNIRLYISKLTQYGSLIALGSCLSTRYLIQNLSELLHVIIDINFKWGQNTLQTRDHVALSNIYMFIFENEKQNVKALTV